jgi:2',3'-cyclic-nucleotide 2'-phosphodiesterase/3'-nucleotidase
MKKLLKRTLAILCVLALTAALLPTALASSQRTVTAGSADFAILSTTDMHGKCWSQNILNDTAENNNMLRVATAVNQIRTTYGADKVMVIDNGDLYQGTPISSYNISLLTQGLTHGYEPDGALP